MRTHPRFATGKREALRLSAPLKGLRLRPDARVEKEFEQQLRARYEQGLRDGEKRLGEQLLQQRCDLLELQKGVLASLQQALPQVRSECEEGLIDLCFEAARKVAASVEITREMVETVVSDALAELEAGHSAVVLLNPADYDLLQQVNGPGPMSATGTGAIEFKPSADITRGGCLVQTHFGILDARRESRLEVLKKTLKT
jgi:flagellar assembly protein FliH